jgi:molecular chaperone IbpA
MTFTAALANDPLFVGFDRIFDRMHDTNHRHVKSNYPPYNILKIDESRYEVELAIAGFSEDDIDIVVEDGVLTISGNKDQNDETIDYLHKGIGARSFKRVFTLAETIIVNDASLKDGILHLYLENVIPDEKKPRKISISTVGHKQLLSE